MPHGREIGLSPSNIVLDGYPAPLPQKGRSPQFSAHVYCGLEGWMDQNATWHGGRSQPKPHCARWGHSPRPNFRSMAGWIKMSLGREVGLSPSDIVLDGKPAPLSQKGAEPPNFRPVFNCGQTAGWIKMPLGMEVDLSPGHIVLDRAQVPCPVKGAQQPPCLFLDHVCCGHGRPSQLLVSSC